MNIVRCRTWSQCGTFGSGTTKVVGHHVVALDVGRMVQSSDIRHALQTEDMGLASMHRHGLSGCDFCDEISTHCKLLHYSVIHQSASFRYENIPW